MQQWASRTKKSHHFPFIDALDSYQKIAKSKKAVKKTVKRNLVCYTLSDIFNSYVLGSGFGLDEEE